MTDTLQDPFTTKGVPAPGEAPTGRSRKTSMIVRTIIIVIVMVMLAELYARAIGPHFPVKLDGLGEMVRKREQLRSPVGTSAQVIFAGDSMMDVGGDPQAFTAASHTFQHAYNASLLGAPVTGTTTWLQQVVLRGTTPRVVVLGVAPSAVLAPDVDFSGVARNQVEDQINQTDDNTWLTITQQASDTSALVQYRQYLRSPQAVSDATAEALSGSDPASNPGFAKMRVDGYWERTINDYGQVVHLSADKLGKRFNPDLVQELTGFEPDYTSLDHALDALADAHVAVLVVIPPIAVPVWEATGVNVAKWRSVAAAIAARADAHGVTAIDYTDAGYDRSQFTDYVHLNEDGAHKMSASIAARLDTLCAEHRVPCS